MKAKDKVMVFFERNYKTQHLQIQAVSVPKRLKEAIKGAFNETAQSQGVDLFEIPQHSELSQVSFSLIFVLYLIECVCRYVAKANGC